MTGDIGEISVEKFQVRAHTDTLFPSHLLPLYFPYPADLFAIEYLRLRILQVDRLLCKPRYVRPSSSS